MAMPRRASAGGSLRSPTRLRAPSASPTTRARADAAIRESIATGYCTAPGRGARSPQTCDLLRELDVRPVRNRQRSPDRDGQADRANAKDCNGECAEIYGEAQAPRSGSFCWRSGSSDREVHTGRRAFVANAFAGELGRHDEDSLRRHAALFDEPFLYRLRAAIGEPAQRFVV